MKDLENILRGKKSLTFVDLEGAQYSHELIEIGAVVGVLGENGRIKHSTEPFKVYVKSIRPVGRVVKDLTGISDQFLSKKGLNYPDAMNAFREYVGKHWDRTLFVTYGNHDLVILNDTEQFHPSYKAPYVRQIRNRYWDFGAWLCGYVQSDQGNPYSLSHALELFGVSFKGQEHDAIDDAYNLMRLYEAVLERKDIMLEEYQKTLARNRKLPAPVKSVMDLLNNGQTVTPEEYKKIIEEVLK